MLVYVYSAAQLQVCWHLQEAGINIYCLWTSVTQTLI